MIVDAEKLEDLLKNINRCLNDFKKAIPKNLSNQDVCGYLDFYGKIYILFIDLGLIFKKPLRKKAIFQEAAEKLKEMIAETNAWVINYGGGCPEKTKEKLRKTASNFISVLEKAVTDIQIKN
ncbi:MAG: hypothetical protein M1334_04845 [Patescibacteria group bacterium]|nr:hypothetical protein [Patescibacteria group bacterium]